MDKILERTLLYDFYGELLTRHQKNIYEQFILEDLSLGEIAEAEGISRQGVYDLIKRCDRALRGYEDRLHLLEKFLAIKDKVRDMNKILDAHMDADGAAKELAADIRRISDEIIEEL